MSTTQHQIEAIARECAEDCNGRTTDYKAEAILTAANRIFDLRKDEYARQYAALKVQESGAVDAIADAIDLAKIHGINPVRKRNSLTALRAIIADGTQKNT